MFLPRWPEVQLLATIPALVWLYGWRTIDTVEWRVITAAPFDVTLDRSQQFLYFSPFTFLLGSYYQHEGLGFDHAFIVVHAIGLLFFAMALYRCLSTIGGAAGWSSAGLILAASPLLIVVITWIGKSDTYLLAFYFLLVSTRSPVTKAMLSVLMFACHRELATAILIGHVLLRGEVRSIAAGLAIGGAASWWFTHGVLETIPASRADFALEHSTQLIVRVLAHPFVYFFAALGPFWLYVFRPSMLSLRRLAVVVLAAVLASISFDFTRVFVIVSVPLLLLLTEEIANELAQSGRVRLFGRHWHAAALGLLAFGQIHVAGSKVLWIRGVEWALTP